MPHQKRDADSKEDLKIHSMSGHQENTKETTVSHHRTPPEEMKSCGTDIRCSAPQRANRTPIHSWWKGKML